jgi:hypothetical protein
MELRIVCESSLDEGIAPIRLSEANRIDETPDRAAAHFQRCESHALYQRSMLSDVRPATFLQQSRRLGDIGGQE